MRRIVAGTLVGLALALSTAAPAAAAAPAGASCPGQELSALAPALGADLGAFVAFEARNPELEGWNSFGEEIDAFAHADRADCPEE
jgi:hypothetical protein